MLHLVGKLQPLGLPEVKLLLHVLFKYRNMVTFSILACSIILATLGRWIDKVLQPASDQNIKDGPYAPNICFGCNWFERRLLICR